MATLELGMRCPASEIWHEEESVEQRDQNLQNSSLTVVVGKKMVRKAGIKCLAPWDDFAYMGKSCEEVTSQLLGVIVV